jgi:acetate kinase
VDVFVRAAVKGIASMAASLGGLDGLVFTAGIGENQPVTRGKIARGLEFLGVSLDVDSNAANAERISSGESRVRVFVLPTDEERAMAALMRPYLVAAAAPAAPGGGAP